LTYRSSIIAIAAVGFKIDFEQFSSFLLSTIFFLINPAKTLRFSGIKKNLLFFLSVIFSLV